MKTEVYSWRVSPDLKSELEDAAREERVSVAKLIERIACEWLGERKAARADDEAQQERIRARAMRFVGSIHGGDPDMAEKARERVREVLARKYGR
jgi:hypothetical protein